MKKLTPIIVGIASGLIPAICGFTVFNSWQAWLLMFAINFAYIFGKRAERRELAGETQKQLNEAKVVAKTESKNYLPYQWSK